MKPSTKNQIKGKARELKGKAKELLGRYADDKKMEDEGTLDQAAGQVQKKIGEIEEDLEE